MVIMGLRKINGMNFSVLQRKDMNALANQKRMQLK